MVKSQTLKIIMKKCGSLILYDVVEFRLPHDGDYWVIEKSNNSHVFVRAEEVVVIGFTMDIEH